MFSLLPLAVFEALYVWLIFTSPNRQVPPNADTAASYYIGDLLILVTIIIPYVIGWALGIMAVLNISFYMKNVQGSLYKKFLKYFVYGIIGVISASIFTQALTSLGTTKLLGINLGWLLVLIYVLLAMIALGYGLIALGSKNLAKIEKV